MRYPFECDACGQRFYVEASITIGAPAGPPCTSSTCNGMGVRVWTAPEFFDRNKPFEYTKRGINLADGVRSPAAQEKQYQKQIGEERANALRAKRERGLSKQPQRLEHAASIPREAFQARQLQFGKDYWRNEGKAALKRDGWLFDG